MAQYDLNNQEDRVRYGGILARLVGIFWLGAVIGVWLGVTPFWEPTWNGLGRFAFAFWWAAPLGLFGGVFYMYLRFAIDWAEHGSSRSRGSTGGGAGASDPTRRPCASGRAARLPRTLHRHICGNSSRPRSRRRGRGRDCHPTCSPKTAART